MPTNLTFTAKLVGWLPFLAGPVPFPSLPLVSTYDTDVRNIKKGLTRTRLPYLTTILTSAVSKVSYFTLFFDLQLVRVVR